MYDVFERLSLPFPQEAIHWRIGSRNKDKTRGLPLAYIDARDVMDRLDGVVGPENWSDRYYECLGRVMCELSVRVNGEWITKTDGAGDTNMEGEKGGISDAFKRAAVKFGVGRYLYSLKSPWVDIDQYGNFTPPDLPRWAKPGAKSDAYYAMQVTLEYIDNVSQIKNGIAEGDIASAAAAWYELGKDNIKKLWIAETKGGPFSHTERDVIKNEFRKYKPTED